MSASFYRIEKGGLGGKFRDVKVVYAKYPFFRLRTEKYIKRAMSFWGQQICKIKAILIRPLFSTKTI